VFKGFFSYTHRDAEVDPHIVEAFSSELEKRVDAKLVNARFEIWRDKEKLQLGDYWDQRIGAAIDTSHIFIILLTPKWISSDYCRKEFEAFQKIEAARDSGGYIIPIYARDIERQAKFLEAEQKELLDHLKRIQYQQIIPKQFARLSNSERIELIEGVADPICDILDRLRG
jgi:TIR domain